ncbi:hypothetical protein F5H01DRAFT_75700 [Linnemannia elongata]|nr:hypothetical protein F5H01DRAFT_75700 [Linnemannia elongata]
MPTTHFSPSTLLRHFASPYPLFRLRSPSACSLAQVQSMWVIASFVFAASLCFHFAGYSVWWFLGIPAASAAMWALHTLYEKSKVVFFLFIFDTFAYFDGVSLWWVLSIPAGFAALCIVLVCILICRHQDMDGRRYPESKYASSVPSHRHRTVNERTHLLPSYISRTSAETPQRIAPSQSSYIFQPSIDTSPGVLPTLSSTLCGGAVGPGLPRYTAPAYPSPAVVDTSRPLYANSTSGSSTIVAGRQLEPVVRNSTQPARKIPAHTPPSEIDGMPLHASVTAQVDDRYPYDRQIKTDSVPYSTTRSVVGVFKCYRCERKKDRPNDPREWTSVGIAVQIWMSSTGHRYRTQLNSQRCKHCHIFGELEVDKDDYVTKVVRVLDGWTRQRSVVKPLQNYPPTGPHRTDLCHACQRGVCHQKPKK